MSMSGFSTAALACLSALLFPGCPICALIHETVTLFVFEPSWFSSFIVSFTSLDV